MSAIVDDPFARLSAGMVMDASLQPRQADMLFDSPPDIAAGP